MTLASKIQDPATTRIPPIEIIAFRHGETDWNRERRFQGHTDIPLNATGRKQAQELSERLKSLEFDAFWSSDLSRALQTAQIVAQPHGHHPRVSAAFREAHLGEAEGVLRGDLLARLGEETWARWASDHPEHDDFRFSGGESKRECLERVRGEVHRWLENFDLESRSVAQLKSPKILIALSTHGGVLKRLVHASEGAPSESIPIPNCSAYRLRLNPGKVWQWSFVEAVR